ncbi:sugar transferase [Cellulomonas shaoxiangyii]|uniref:Sugar transferase n=1 Tax=Cellulomonas shaoxiangyii TaxID=2566013 RepID=A0A4P7SJV5_9CELL|nr:sugar transferase [Cellulomonas shaoxiangyii]QCB94442.1 sugar transferase [Cellulomonas shaoxiangyii]TGY85153.1 sugar transferase [Cellulomonas shaoxiangyii]
MTLTADHASSQSGSAGDRRGHAREPRRSWASSQPFESRRTQENSDPTVLAHAWRAVGTRYVVAAAVTDVVLTLAVCLAVLSGAMGPAASTRWALAAAVAFAALAGLTGGYRRRQVADGPAEFQSLLRAALVLILLLTVLGYVFRVPVPRSYVLVGVPVTVVLCWAARHVQRRRLHRGRLHGAGMMRTVVVGDELSAARVVRDISAVPHHGYRIDGVCLPSFEGPRRIGGAPVLGAVADVVQIAADRAADVVLVTGAYLSGDAVRRLSWALSRAGAQLVVVPDIVEVAGPRLTVRPTAGLSLLQVEIEAPRPRLLVKQVLDVTLAAVALLLLAPVLAVATTAVALSSQGGAIYRQTRVGRDGRTFTLFKLRTMYRDADERRAALLASGPRDGVLFKMADDPRITPVGRVLRRWSVDELPQLFNILRGDMALVGPRPPLLEEVEAYEDPVQRRLHVKPGLTGLWQVSGRSDLTWEESVQLDLRYVDNWSVAMDLLILWKTARAVLTGAGAY